MKQSCSFLNASEGLNLAQADAEIHPIKAGPAPAGHRVPPKEDWEEPELLPVPQPNIGKAEQAAADTARINGKGSRLKCLRLCRNKGRRR